MTVAWDIGCDLAMGSSYATSLNPYVDEKSSMRIRRMAGEIHSMTLSLNNSDGRFNTEYLLSPVYGRWGKRGLPIRVQVNLGSGFGPMFTGTIWAYKLTGQKEQQRCVIRCVGRLKAVQDQKNPRFAASSSRGPDDALQVVLTACGLTSGDWSIFTNDATTLPLHYATGGDGLQECMRVIDDTFGAVLFEAKNGDVTALSGYDLGDSGTGYSPNDTWGIGTNVLPDDNLGGPDLDYRRDIQKSKIEAAYQRFITGSVGAIVVYTHPKNTVNGNQISIAAGTSITFEAKYILPVHTITTPASTTDFKSTSLTVAAVDHGDKAVVTVTNPTGGALDLEYFQIRGDTLVYKHPRSAQTGDAEAIPAYGTIKFTANYLTVATALQTLTINTDWKANSAADGSGTAKTGTDLVFTVTDYGVQADVEGRNTTNATIYLTKFQIRGAAVQIERGRAAAMSASEIVSQNPSGGVSVVDGGKIIHSLPLAGLTGDPTDVRTYKFRDTSAELVQWTYSQMRVSRQLSQIVTLPFSWSHADIESAMVTRELYDLVHYTDIGGSGYQPWLSNVKGFFRIVGLEHDIEFGPKSMPVSRVTLVPAWLWTNPSPGQASFDTFDRADTASGLGNNSPLAASTWNGTTSSFQIDTNRAQVISIGTAQITLPVSGGVTNSQGEVGATFSGLAAFAVRAVISSSDASDTTAPHVRAELNYNAGTISLTDRTGGVTTVRSSKGAADGFVIGASHEVLLRCERNQASGGETWTAFVDGVRWCESDAINQSFNDYNGIYKSGNLTGDFIDDYYMRTF